MLDGSLRHADPFRHAVYGLAIASEFALGSLPPCDIEAAADIRLLQARPGYFADRAEQTPDDRWYRYRSLPDGGVHITIPGILDAEVSADGSTALCAPAPGSDPRAFEANILNFVLTIALTFKGEEPLHATVVALGDRAIGLLGDSGAGKSTLAAHLLSQGATLVTDDLLRVRYVGHRPLVHAGPPRLKLFEADARRLLPDVAREASFNPMSGKLLVEAGACGIGESPGLAALFRLDEPSGDCGVSVRLVDGGEAVRTLLASTLHRDHRPVQRMAGQFRQIERLARAVPLFALGYPRQHALLPAVAAAVGQCV